METETIKQPQVCYIQLLMIEEGTPCCKKQPSGTQDCKTAALACMPQHSGYKLLFQLADCHQVTLDNEGDHNECEFSTLQVTNRQ
jgi:hypothetical protein